MFAGTPPRSHFQTSSKGSPARIWTIAKTDYDSFVAKLSSSEQTFLKASQFSARSGAMTTFPSADGGLNVLLVVENPTIPFEYGTLSTRLPKGNYQLASEPTAPIATAIALGWALGAYRFDRYKKSKKEGPKLVWPKNADQTEVLRLAEAAYLTRDLINTPASDMGPEELETAARALAKLHGAKVSVIEGEALLAKNYPMIHAVGRASTRAPRLIDLRFGGAKGPRVTLVGKGVCFDTGGLDIKPAAFMKLMKKDMGGAAFVLGLAHALASSDLKLQLRVLIPAVENSVSGNAFRPLDVLATRKGITVEVGDTDAEGRLVLGDALTEAASETPELVVDAATLTGAARVALGTQIPVIFASKTATWQALELESEKTMDPLWRLPLYAGYRSKLDSAVADMNNVGSDSYGGAITAALFLQEFVPPELDWLHMDTMGYNLESRPGRPTGGEALGLFALDSYLRARFGNGSESTGGSGKTAKREPQKGKSAPRKASGARKSKA